MTNNYSCFVDDDSLFRKRPVPNSPLCVKGNRFSEICGISHGLVCLCCPNTIDTVLWNPSIRKSIAVAVPNTPFVGHRFVAFGGCPATTDPKIVVIKQSWDTPSYPCEVMVYTLSSVFWRRLSSNLPTQPLRFLSQGVAVDGFIYWRGRLRGHNMIISFDVTNEGFEMIHLPDSLAHIDLTSLQIHKLRESLAILQYGWKICTVWRMEGGVQRSFTKLYTIHEPFRSLVGFSKSGVPIVLVKNNGKYELVFYEPNSQHKNVLKVSGDPLRFTANSYTESLLLLGRSDCSGY